MPVNPRISKQSILRFLEKLGGQEICEHSDVSRLLWPLESWLVNQVTPLLIGLHLEFCSLGWVHFWWANFQKGKVDNGWLEESWSRPYRLVIVNWLNKSESCVGGYLLLWLQNKNFPPSVLLLHFTQRFFISVPSWLRQNFIYIVIFKDCEVND